MENSDSSELSRLTSYLERRKFRFISSIRPSQSTGVAFDLLVSSDVIGKRVDKEHTSIRQLAQLRNRVLKEIDLAIEWIVTRGEQAAIIEAALLAAFQERFPSVIGAVFISSIYATPVSVWLEPTSGAKVLPPIGAMSEVCKELLKVFEVESVSVSYTNSEELPSNSMILRLLKTHSPISVDLLEKKLKLEGMSIPDKQWLHRKLDTMRRNGLLVWLQDETYSLTELALSVVPHGNSRSSSDVSRALALGRRKW